MIEVRRISEGDPIEVVVRDGAGETRHHLTISITLRSSGMVNTLKFQC
jgi:hypothetical protein